MSIAGIIATINPHQKEPLVIGLIVIAILLLATISQDLWRMFKKLP